MPDPQLRIFVGESAGTAVVELRGRVRYIDAPALRGVLDDVLQQPAFAGLVVDLRDVTAIDSTGLGLLARTGTRTRTRTGTPAIVVAREGEVTAVLRSAALDEVLRLVDTAPFEAPPVLAESVPVDERPAVGDAGRLILDAHRDLASLSDRNRETYRDVIALLEAQLADKP
jgi:anti-anti-sigma factor